VELFQAHKQWATRPADQRFTSLDDLLKKTQEYAAQARTIEANWSDLRVAVCGQDDDLCLTGKAGVPASLTHFVFGQLARRADAPAEYLRRLPATLAAQNLNHGLKAKGDSSKALLLFHQNNGLVLRSATSDRYERFWNCEVAERLRDSADKYGLIPARPTFSWDGQPFDPNSPPALYASDKDMFAFVMSTERTLRDPLGNEGLYRGLIVTNSEVGDCSLGMMAFLFNEVCGNHIIWGAKDVVSIRLPHRGTIRDRFVQAQVEIRKYLDHSGAQDESKLQAAFQTVIAGTKDEVLDKLFGLSSLNVSRKALAASYDAVRPEQDGPANTVYGMVQGITRHSQTLPFADERTQLDRAAGRLLEYAF
jgi:hypothetical protein